MKTNCYHYLKVKNNQKKEQYRGPLSEVCFIERAIHIDITSRMFYAFKEFHEIPHGSELNMKRRDHEIVLKIAGNQEEGVVVDDIVHSQIKNTTNSNIKVCYPSSEEIMAFELLQINHNYWLELVLEHGESNIARGDTIGGIAKRITIGWKPKQPFSYTKSKKYKNILMPYAGFPEFKNNKVFSYPKDLSNIMSLSQTIVDKEYEKEKPMNNKKRNQIFGSKFGKSFDKSCTSRFEFLDIFAEKDGSLNRHCDYSNDYRKGYTYGASYSYLIKRKKEDEIYRVNFIMCTRVVVGSFMEEVNNK